MSEAETTAAAQDGATPMEGVVVTAENAPTVPAPVAADNQASTSTAEPTTEAVAAPEAGAAPEAVAAPAVDTVTKTEDAAPAAPVAAVAEPGTGAVVETKQEAPAPQEQTKAPPRKIQVDLLSPNAAPPSGPKDRDFIFGEGDQGHQANLLLQDLIALHRLVWEISHDSLPKEESEVEVLTERLFQLMKKGKGRDLAGMKDVPRPFLIGSGRFMQIVSGEWKELSDDEAKKLMLPIIFARMKEDAANGDSATLKDLSKEFQDFLLAQDAEKAEKAGQPLETKPSDVILLQRTDTDGDKAFTNQIGNKSLFLLASQHVNSEITSPSKRLEAALSVFLSKNAGPENIPKPEGEEKPRFVLCKTKDDGQKLFSLVNPVDAAEVTLLFVFEVWLEKEMAAKRDAMGVATSDVVSHDDPKPSTDPIETPTPHDVLFGRGGMTNSHPGNKRFRDVIALHRPDYIKAIKNDKPNVARRIVRAIRTATPPGRFLKKGEDGMWYDVGNRIAAEKASQALREKSNAEKRQRSAQREAMRGNKRDGGSDSGPPAKKSKVGDAGISIASPLLANQLNYVGAPIGTQTVVDGKGEVKSVKVDPNKDELKTEGLPPNAVDKDGNILVTDWDILAGRGGLTNHHRGNKRFRDIVALHRPDYIRAPKVQKPSVARVIVRAIRNGDPPGRFLKKDEKTGRWYDIGDKKAAEKTSQALREKGNEKDQHPASSTGALDGEAKSPAFLLPAPTGTATDASAVAATAAGTVTQSPASTMPALPGATAVGAVKVETAPVAAVTEATPAPVVTEAAPTPIATETAPTPVVTEAAPTPATTEAAPTPAAAPIPATTDKVAAAETAPATDKAPAAGEVSTTVEPVTVDDTAAAEAVKPETEAAKEEAKTEMPEEESEPQSITV